MFEGAEGGTWLEEIQQVYDEGEDVDLTDDGDDEEEEEDQSGVGSEASYPPSSSASSLRPTPTRLETPRDSKRERLN